MYHAPRHILQSAFSFTGDRRDNIRATGRGVDGAVSGSRLVVHIAERAKIFDSTEMRLRACGHAAPTDRGIRAGEQQHVKYMKGDCRRGIRVKILQQILSLVDSGTISVSTSGLKMPSATSYPPRSNTREGRVLCVYY